MGQHESLLHQRPPCFYLNGIHLSTIAPRSQSKCNSFILRKKTLLDEVGLRLIRTYHESGTLQ